MKASPTAVLPPSRFAQRQIKRPRRLPSLNYALSVEVLVDYAHPFCLDSDSSALGEAALRERFVARFQEVNLHATLLNRTAMEQTVVDCVEISRTFSEGTGKIRLLMIREVQNGRIPRAWSIAGPKTLDGRT